MALSRFQSWARTQKERGAGADPEVREISYEAALEASRHRRMKADGVAASLGLGAVRKDEETGEGKSDPGAAPQNVAVANRVGDISKKKAKRAAGQP